MSEAEGTWLCADMEEETSFLGPTDLLSSSLCGQRGGGRALKYLSVPIAFTGPRLNKLKQYVKTYEGSVNEVFWGVGNILGKKK